MYIRVLCTIIYQADDLALSASDKRGSHFASQHAFRSILHLDVADVCANARNRRNCKSQDFSFGGQCGSEGIHAIASPQVPHVSSCYRSAGLDYWPRREHWPHCGRQEHIVVRSN